MDSTVRSAQVTPVDTPGCSSKGTDITDETTSPPCIERKWSWIIVAASFLNQFIAHGMLQILGLYNVEFLEAFGESKTTTAWITSVAGGCIMGLGPLVAVILDRTSARLTACIGGVISTLGLVLSWFGNSVIYLSITFGVVMGGGLCMIYLSSAVIVGQYFERRRAFATAIASCGGSVGSLLLPIYTSYLIEEYVWRGSLFLLAALCFQTVVFSCTLRQAALFNTIDTIDDTAPESEPIHEKCSVRVSTVESLGTSRSDQPLRGSVKDGNDPDSTSCSVNHVDTMQGCVDDNTSSTRSRNRKCIITLKKMIIESPLNNLGMLLFCISAILANVGFGSVIITLPDFIYISLGSKDIAAYMLMCIAAGRIGGALIASFLGNWKPLHCLHMICVSNVLMGIVAFLYTSTANTYIFGILSFLLGIGLGAAIAWIAQITAHLVGVTNLAQGLGCLLAGTGVGRLTGPPLGGFLFDISGDYMASFWMAAGFFIAGGLLPVIALVRERCRTQYDVTMSGTR